jgi:zinc-ribbon domain
MTTPRFCEQCGATLSASANFCPNCGVGVAGGIPITRVAGATAGGNAAGARGGLAGALPWLIPSVAVVGVIAFAVMSGRPDPAPDISQLSPDERVDRLFNRVMTAASAGKMDSVAFFAPMAVTSFQALEPLSAHRRYDLGLIHLVSGDAAQSLAQAELILAEQPKHLLGLALAMRSAGAGNDDAARKRFATRFLESLQSERARALQEYVDHATDITEATA